jgi:hypothetical protein
MKKTIVAIAAAIFVTLVAVKIFAADTVAGGHIEYVTIRWDGRDHTHIIRPGGQVEFIGAELKKAPKPSAADERSFYMNLAANGLAKEGFELVAMSSDDMVFRRAR